MTENRVSAIITAYNSERFISDAIASVMAQTRPIDEFVVIDDGSIDDTAQVVSSCFEKGIRYIWQSNRGASIARNRGIQETTGEYIAFLDADDIWLEDKTKRQMDFLLSHPDIALVSGAEWWWDVTRNKCHLEVRSPKKSGAIRREILISNYIGNPSMVIMRRSVLKEVGLFDPCFHWGEDWELWIRIASHHKVAILPEPVIVYRSHVDNLSHTNSWERATCEWDISRLSIAKFRPAWQRPFLKVRAWSNVTLSRADFLFEQGYPRRTQIAYATCALITNPFEKSSEKLKVFARATLGEKMYQRGRQIVRRWIKKSQG